MMPFEKELYCAWDRKDEARDLYNAGVADIKYRIHHSGTNGRWSGIRSFRQAVQKNSGVMWPWDMVGAPHIQALEWWILRD